MSPTPPSAPPVATAPLTPAPAPANPIRGLENIRDRFTQVLSGPAPTPAPVMAPVPNTPAALPVPVPTPAPAPAPAPTEPPVPVEPPAPAPETVPVLPEEITLTFPPDDAPFPTEPVTDPSAPLAAPPAAVDDRLDTFLAALPENERHILESKLLRTPRGQQMLEAMRYAQLANQSTEQGGLGGLPPIDVVRTWQADATNWRASQQELAANPQSYWLNFLDPANSRTIPQDRISALTTLRDTLSTQARAVYQDIFERPFVSRAVDDFYAMAANVEQAAAAERDDARKTDLRNQAAYAIDVARALEKRFLGIERPLGPGGIPERPAVQPGRPDPERQRLEAELAEYRRRDQATRGQHGATIKSTLFTTAESLIRNDIVHNLSHPLAPGARPISETMSKQTFDAVVSNLLDQVVDVVYGHGDPNRSLSPTMLQEFEVNVQSAIAAGRTLTPQDAARHPSTKIMLQMARNAMRSILPAYIRSESQRIFTQSNGAHATAQVAAVRTDVPPSAVAIPTSVVPVPALTRQPNESMEDYARRKFSSAARSELGGREAFCG